MRKQLLLTVALALLLTGCGKAKQQQPLPEPTEPTETVTEPVTEPPTEAPTLNVTERLTELKAMNRRGTAFVLDEHGHLTEAQLTQYQSSLQALSDSKDICTALVITDALAGFSPDRLAQKYYTALFGENTDGFLLLINNDTGEDLYYTAGLLSVQNTDMRLAQASGYLVEKDYPAAIDCLLPAEDELLLLPPEEETEEQSAD